MINEKYLFLAERGILSAPARQKLRFCYDYIIFFNSNVTSLFTNYGDLQQMLSPAFLGFREKSLFEFVLHIFALLHTKIKTYKPVHKDSLKIMVWVWVVVPSQFLTDELDISLN